MQTNYKYANRLLMLILLFSMAFIALSTVNTVSADSSIIYVNGSGGNDDWNGEALVWDDSIQSGPKKSIKNATGTVTEGGTINIADGLYTGENNTNITIDKNMTIVGQNKEGTIINGTDSAQIFNIQKGTNVTISNLTLANGNATQNLTSENKNMTYGGAIFNNGTLTVNNSIFTNNTATYGGAILNNGTLTVTSSIFTNNRASGANNTTIGGGAIFNVGNLTIESSSFTNNIAIGAGNSTGGAAILNYGNLTINSSIFTNNTVNYGNYNYGGVILNYGNSTVENSTFTNNTADFGGAICNYNNLTILGSTFTNNTAKSKDNSSPYEGGAIFNVGNLTIGNNSKFTGNIANYGGAIFNYGSSTVNGNLNVSSSTFTNNEAISGGAILNLGNSIVNSSTFNNNTVSGINDASMGGGAIYNMGSLTIENNSIFTSNNAFSGGAIFNYADSTFNGNLTVSDSTFTSNTANGTNDASMGGGAIENQGTLTVKSSKFISNTANLGGTISNYAGTSITPVIVMDSTFMGNIAGEAGGAIYNTGNLAVSGSTFTSNTARSKNASFGYTGGAISNEDGILKVSSSTFTSNIADYGGAIFSYNSTVTVSGSTFKNNGATTEGDAIDNHYGKLIVHFCQIVGNYITGYAPDSVYNEGGSADVRYNWWGLNTGPSKGRVVGCTYAPWLVLTLSTSSTTVKAGGTSTITANLLYDSKGYYHSPTGGHLPDGIPVTFATKIGTIGSQASTVNGIARSTLKAGSVGGIVDVSAKIDSQTIQIPLKVIATYPKNYATGVSRTSTIAIKFSENIKTSINWSKIYVKNLSTGKLVSISKWIRGNILYIKTSRRNAYNWYRVCIPNGAVKNYAGSNLIRGYIFKFKTGRY